MDSWETLLEIPFIYLST
uniref:Uncharacterized protein n=1 Tax=Rhizophora mucronata TaxID=61149 RepID=A0A2P2QPS4_RHIMU